jgi:hypothetical protein
MGSTEFDATRQGLWYRARFAGLAVALALAVGTLASACSTGGGGDEASACHTARQKISAWLESELAADNALTTAGNQWTRSNPQNLEPGPGLTTAIDQYNTNIQTFQAARTKGDQDLAAANQAIGRCDQAQLPKACKGEFALYTPIMENHGADRGAQDALTQAIADEQQALMNNSTSGYNAAVGRQNAAARQRNDDSTAYNVTLKPAYNAAVAKCDKAT